MFRMIAIPIAPPAFSKSKHRGRSDAAVQTLFRVLCSLLSRGKIAAGACNTARSSPSSDQRDLRSCARTPSLRTRRRVCRRRRVRRASAMTRRILIIDDEADILELVSLSLELIAGWHVITADSGTEGLATAQRELPDAILLDVMMSGMDGPRTFEICRAHES